MFLIQSPCCLPLMSWLSMEEWFHHWTCSSSVWLFQPVPICEAEWLVLPQPARLSMSPCLWVVVLPLVDENFCLSLLPLSVPLSTVDVWWPGPCRVLTHFLCMDHNCSKHVLPDLYDGSFCPFESKSLLTLLLVNDIKKPWHNSSVLYFLSAYGLLCSNCCFPFMRNWVQIGAPLFIVHHLWNCIQEKL